MKAPGFAPYPAGRRRGPLVAVAVAGALVVVAAIAVVAFVLHGQEDGGNDGATAAGSGDLASPVRFLRVQGSTPGACSGAGTPSVDGSTCYQLGTGMTVNRLARIAVLPPTAGYQSWRISIKLEPDDVPAFAGLTREIAAEPPTTPQRLLAIVVGGEVLSAPEVQEALSGGDIEITGTFTRQEAETLVRQILGSR